MPTEDEIARCLADYRARCAAIMDGPDPASTGEVVAMLLRVRCEAVAPVKRTYGAAVFDAVLARMRREDSAGNE